MDRVRVYSVKYTSDVMLQEYYLIKYQLVRIQEVAVEYIQVDRTGMNVYSVRIML